MANDKWRVQYQTGGHGGNLNLEKNEKERKKKYNSKI